LFPSGRFHITREDGSGEREVAGVPVGANALRWSRDGGRMAYVSSQAGKSAIFIATADGEAMRTISGPPPWIPIDSFVGYVSPAWSPDGLRMAFGASRLGRHELMIANTDGTGLARIGGGVDSSYFGPSWSPDGTRLAVSISVGGSASVLHTLKPDGTGVTSLGITGSGPSWSPDGTRIMYTARIADNTDIYTVNPDGAGVTRLTDHPERDFDPAWSPDGTSIAFASLRLTASHIFTMNADGTGVTKLPTELFNNVEPVWRP
jgi:Tol biopolymer transport system component